MKILSTISDCLLLKMNSNIYSLKVTNSHYLLLNITIIALHNGKISLIFCEGYLSFVAP